MVTVAALVTYDKKPCMAVLVRTLDLQKPQYLQTASYGHFGQWLRIVCFEYKVAHNGTFYSRKP